MPDIKNSLYLIAIVDIKYKYRKINFRNQVYGFDTNCIKKQALVEPLVDVVGANQIVIHPTYLKIMNIAKMNTIDSFFSTPF